MSNTPDISIIIPHYNQNEALADCIDALEKQCYDLKHIEVIVIDNNSLYPPSISSHHFGNFRLLQEKTPGPGPVRNKGIRAAQGNTLFFIDADCIADKNWIAAGMTALKQEGVSAVGGDVKIKRDPERPVSFIEAYEHVFAYQQEAYIKKHGFSGSGNLAVKRPIFDIAGFFPGIAVAEDRAWGTQLRAAGYSVIFCPGMIVYHPAREKFSELFSKWARHLRHDFAELKALKHPLARWLFRSFLVLCSIPVHAIKVMTSNRLSGFIPKTKAILTLAVIRLYRVGFMLRMIASKKFRNDAISWNIKKDTSRSA